MDVGLDRQNKFAQFFLLQRITIDNQWMSLFNSILCDELHWLSKHDFDFDCNGFRIKKK